VQNKIANLKLRPVGQAIEAPNPGRSPFQYGYRLAEIVRERASLSPSEPVFKLEDIARDAAGSPFHGEEQNHVPGQGIRAVVGKGKRRGMIWAGPRPSRPDNARFLIARCLYHALFACQRTERLVTDAYTWEQQVSRAFAAELLAPRRALAARTPGWADSSKIEELASEFQASTILIERQLENAGVALTE
jgi:hypothetical protein